MTESIQYCEEKWRVQGVKSNIYLPEPDSFRLVKEYPGAKYDRIAHSLPKKAKISLRKGSIIQDPPVSISRTPRTESEETEFVESVDLLGLPVSVDVNSNLDPCDARNIIAFAIVELGWEVTWPAWRAVAQANLAQEEAKKISKQSMRTLE